MVRLLLFVPRFNFAPAQMAPVIFSSRHLPTIKLMRKE
jgi:hypothetical protein